MSRARFIASIVRSARKGAPALPFARTARRRPAAAQVPARKRG